MKKQFFIALACTLALFGCKKVTVDFTYSPAEPKAGEAITFSNTSSAGETWTWTFGDNTTSTSKNPNKIYKKPGEYIVTLMVDSSRYQKHSKIITVFDTIPTFVCSTDTIMHYYDVTLTANVYNPFKYELSYLWQLPENCVIQSGSVNESSIIVYFTSPDTANVKLDITQNGNVYTIEKELSILETLAPAIVMQQEDGTIMRQRIINDRLEDITPATEFDTLLIAQFSDTAFVFNNQEYTISTLAQLIPGFAGVQISHMQMDVAAMKWYISTPNGLFVANFDGSNLNCIDTQATGAICVDAERSRIYWANTNGVYAMPLIKSKNNQFTTKPLQYNQLNDVDMIIVNNTPQ
jgi:PKD repeat protein